jgi:nitrogen-specific signal transduction histidine kinase
MNLLPACILYTQNPALARRIAAYVRLQAMVRHVKSPTALVAIIQQYDPTLVFIDLRAENCRELVRHINSGYPETLIVALGTPRSQPFLEAMDLGVYAVEATDLEREETQALVKRAQNHLRLVQENRILRLDNQKAKPPPPPATPTKDPAGPIPHFSQAFRHFENVDALLESMAEGILSYAKVSRVGIFAVEPETGIYTLRAGIRCLKETGDIEVPPDSPLVTWMHRHAHLAARADLTKLADPSERLLLQQSLDVMGAEVLMPLHGEDGILGWLFVGHRITGTPFEPNDLESLMLLAEHVSVTLQNALLHGDIALQRTLAGTVLHAIPVGIVAADRGGRVRWFNEAAQTILEVPSDSVLHHPIGHLGNRLANLLRRCLEGDPPSQVVEWTDPRTHRSLSIQAQPLASEGACMGAVMMIHDLTHERLLQEEKGHLERAAFWTDLAAAMSHEVRNPLVAISTFSQLLPERYTDPEFRNQFSKLVAHEVGRLNSMLDQINSFANPPPLTFEAVDVEDLIKKAASTAAKRLPQDHARLETSLQARIPDVRGDMQALVDCLAHLIVNAMEAVAFRKDGLVVVGAAANRGKEAEDHVSIHVRDNGPGVPVTIRDKVFSPFCSSKARGIGLGLPIARRTLSDHNGRLEIDTGPKGTTITLVIPAWCEAAATPPR